ncbi:MAG TPA: hypothetical protein VFM37_08870 [Pseudonocardiaceae bacterium]|nr:hypothetical protein [Pseudonocardiaceae bacterium]
MGDQQPGGFADASTDLEYDRAHEAAHQAPHEAGRASGRVPAYRQAHRDPVVTVTPAFGGDYSYDLAHAANDGRPRAAGGADLEYDLAHEAVGVTTPMPPPATYREPDPPAMPPCDGDYSYDLAHDVPRSR